MMKTGEYEMPPTDQQVSHAERIAVIEARLEEITPKINFMYDFIVEQRGAGKLIHWVTLIFGGAIATILITKWQALLAWLGAHP